MAGTSPSQPSSHREGLRVGIDLPQLPAFRSTQAFDPKRARIHARLLREVLGRASFAGGGVGQFMGEAVSMPGQPLKRSNFRLFVKHRSNISVCATITVQLARILVRLQANVKWTGRWPFWKSAHR